MILNIKYSSSTKQRTTRGSQWWWNRRHARLGRKHPAHETCARRLACAHTVCRKSWNRRREALRGPVVSLLHTVMARMPEELQRGRRRDPEGRRVGSLAGGLTPATGPTGPIDAKTLGCMFRVFSPGSGLVAPYGPRGRYGHVRGSGVRVSLVPIKM